MFNGYEVFPMTAGGDLCALHDAEGRRVAMGTREVCETLLFLLNNSSLVTPPRRYVETPSRRRLAGPEREPSEEEKTSHQIDVAGRAEQRMERAAAPEKALRPLSDGGRAAAQTPHPTRVKRISAAQYGILDGTYLTSPHASSFRYVGLYVTLMLGSAFLTWLLFLSL